MGPLAILKKSGSSVTFMHSHTRGRSNGVRYSMYHYGAHLKSPQNCSEISFDSYSFQLRRLLVDGANARRNDSPFKCLLSQETSLALIFLLS